MKNTTTAHLALLAANLIYGVNYTMAKIALPDYEVIAIHGQAPKQQFDVRCRLQQHNQEFVASGPSRRKAEQAAARTALIWLEQQDDR